jgi:anti-sigma regulatory factor (Ser/Thr protein kinase)
MRYALFLPVFDELSDARVVAQLAAEAERAGWDGVFVWDHIAYRAPVQAVADPWVVLAAMAMTTERIRIGPMVTPLARRRPVKLAREIATLDRLSGGRLVLGVGLGGDNSRELSATGEQTDDQVRARMLDEALEVLRAAWTGEPVHHTGEQPAQVLTVDHRSPDRDGQHVRTLLLTSRDISDARADVARLCASHSVSQSRADSLAVVVSELLGNALLHGMPPVHYDIRLDGVDVLVQVDDASTDKPVQASRAAPDGENGRGMFIVDALSRRWGTVSTLRGKQVWARVWA